MKNPLPLLSELLPRELMGRLQADCATLVGGTTITFRADGGALTDLFTVSPYCRQIVSNPTGQSRCAQSRRDLAMEAILTGKSQQALCHAGVGMIAVPLLLGGEAVAATVVSLQPFPENRDAAFLTARALEMDPGLLVSVPRTPPLSADRLKAAVRLLEDLHRLYGLQLHSALESEQVRRQVAQSAQRMKALYNTSRAITSTLSLDQMVRIFVEQMAILACLDRCLLALWDSKEKQLEPIGSYGLTPHENQRFHAADPLDLGIRPEWWERLERGRIVYLPLGWLRQTPTREIMGTPEGRRAMLAPVVSGGTLWAVAYLDGARDADALTEQETDLLMAVAGQAGIAIANISQFRQEQKVARVLQESLRSPIPPRVGDYSIGPLYLPALAEAQVGGDFFDLIEVDDHRFAFLLGDVSGKGIGAAVHTGMMKYMARALIVDDPTPRTLVTRLNRAVSAHGGIESGFITFFYALVDRRENRFLYTNAGHEPPLLFRIHHGDARELGPSGPAVGLLDEFDYPQEDLSFAEGDGLLVYTDGAVEARDPEGEFFGLGELRKLFLKVARKDGPEIVAYLHNELCKFAGGGLQDDLALLAIKRLPPADAVV